MPRPRTFDEDQVLDRAADAFREHGFEGTSVAALENATGLGRQSLYNAFGGKQALFERALERYRARAADRLDQVEGVGLDGIRRFFRGSLETLLSDPHRRGCLLTRAQVESGASPAPLAACVTNEASMRSYFTDRLREASEAGELPRDLDPDVTAGLLVTHAHGLSTAVAGGADAEALEVQTDLLIRRLGSPSD